MEELGLSSHEIHISWYVTMEKWTKMILNWHEQQLTVLHDKSKGIDKGSWDNSCSRCHPQIFAKNIT